MTNLENDGEPTLKLLEPELWGMNRQALLSLLGRVPTNEEIEKAVESSIRYEELEKKKNYPK